MWFKRQPSADINAKDPAVRSAAAKRLNNLVVLRATYESDRDRGVRETARARYRHLLAGGDALDLAHRRAALHACHDAQIVAHVARSAREPELRALAIERIDEPALLREVCAHDPDPSIVEQARGRLAWLGFERE